MLIPLPRFPDMGSLATIMVTKVLTPKIASSKKNHKLGAKLKKKKKGNFLRRWILEPKGRKAQSGPKQRARRPKITAARSSANPSPGLVVLPPSLSLQTSSFCCPTLWPTVALCHSPEFASHGSVHTVVNTLSGCQSPSQQRGSGLAFGHHIRGRWEWRQLTVEMWLPRS